jgi:hypothetical protein
MGLTETILFYGTVGIAVAVAMYVRPETKTAGERTFQVSTALAFWPLYLPVLLSAPKADAAARDTPTGSATDEMADAIA